MYTDPIADLLTRIRNAYLARKLDVEIPYSKLKEGVAQVLEEYEFIDGLLVEGEGKERKLVIALKYDAQGKPVVEGIRRVSKPGLRKYTKSKTIPSVRGGFGISIVTTSQGVMSGSEAQKKNLGGEVIAYIW